MRCNVNEVKSDQFHCKTTVLDVQICQIFNFLKNFNIKKQFITLTGLHTHWRNQWKKLQTQTSLASDAVVIPQRVHQFVSKSCFLILIEFEDDLLNLLYIPILLKALHIINKRFKKRRKYLVREINQIKRLLVVFTERDT